MKTKMKQLLTSGFCVKLLVFFGLGLGLTLPNAAQAADPVAVWDGFTSLTSGNYTWTKSTGTTVTDGVVTIGSDGGLTMASPTGFDKTITFIADIENYDPTGAQMTVFDIHIKNKGDNHVNLSNGSATDTKLYQLWNNTSGYGNVGTISTGKVRVIYTYHGAKDHGAHTYVVGGNSAAGTGCYSGQDSIVDLGIGCYSTTSRVATNMKVHRLAIFTSELSEVDAKAYKFPSEVLNDDAYLWLDASDASTISRDGTGMVTKWASRNAGGKAATSYSANNVNAGPTIKPQGLGGKNVVDFGAAGSKKDLKFDRSTTIRTIFMVAAVANNNNNNTFFLTDDSTCVFHRGNNGKYFNSTYAGIFTSGTVRRNGETVSNPGDVSVPTSYGVYTFVSTDNATASRICQDRSVSQDRTGGKQVAELIIFNKTLSDVERDWIENYLTSKWMSGAPEPNNSFGFDNSRAASTILGGTAPSITDEWATSPTYTKVRGSDSNYAATINNADKPTRMAPYGQLTGMKAKSWSVHASMKLADVNTGILFGITAGAVHQTSAAYIALEYVGNNQVRVVKGTGKNNKSELIAPTTIENATTAYHSYLLTHTYGDSPYCTLYVDGVKIADSATMTKVDAYQWWCVGGIYGGPDSIGSVIMNGAQVDDFAIWTTTALSAEQAKGVAAQFPTWPRIYTASVTGDGNWSTLGWSPAKPAGGFPAGADFVIENNGSADVTTVTIDTPINANSVKVVSATKVLKFGHISNLTASSYDFSEASGGVGFGVTGGWVVTEPLKSYIRCNNIKVIFDSDDTNGATFDYGSTEAERISVSPWISSHVVFNRGTHTFKGTSENSGQSFGANATADNPTFYAKNGATVNWYSRNPCGWSVQANKNGIIRIDGTSKIKTLNSESGTWYWVQQFYLDPGAQLEIAAATTCLTGGGNENAPHFFMPASQNGTATISSSGSGAFRLTKDSYPGIGVSVGEGSTLLVTASLASTATQSYIAKYGTGALKFTGNTTSYQGGLQVKAGQMIYASASSMMAAATVSIDSGAQFVFGAANNTFANVISGAGAVVKDGTDTTTTLSGANTYSGGTTVEAGTLKLTGSSIGSGAYTVAADATLDFGTHRDKTIVGTSAGTVKITLTDAEKTTLDGKGQITPFNVSGDAFNGTVLAFDGSGAVYEIEFEYSEGKIVVTKKEGSRQSPYHVTNPTNETWTIAGWTDSSTPALEVRPEDWGKEVSANVTVGAEQVKALTADRVLTLGTLAVTNAGTLTVSASDANTMTATEILVNNTGALTLSGNAITTADINDSESTGATTIGFAPGAATIKAGANTILNTVGTGAYTIGANKKLTVKASGLNKTQLTNNGTLNIVGGTLAAPVVINDNGSGGTGLGTVTIESGVVKDYATSGNKVYNISGVAGETTLILGSGQNWGMTDGTSIRNTKVIVQDKEFWLERDNAFDSTVDLQIDKALHICNNKAYTIGSLSGSADIVKTGSESLTITMDRADSEYSGSSQNAMIVAGTYTLTLSGAYTGALTVNEGAKVKLTGSAAPSSISGAGSVTIASTTGTATLTSNLANFTGTITVDASVTTLNLGTARPTCSFVFEGTTDVVYTENIADDGVVHKLTVTSGTPNYRVFGTDGTEKVITGGKYTPSVCGGVCLYDYTFTNKTATTSSQVIKAASTSQVTNKDLKGDVNAVYTNYNETTGWYTALRTTVRPHNKGGFTLTTPFTVAVAGCFPSYTNTVLASFGSSRKCLFLSSGDKANEVKLVAINANQDTFRASDCTVLTTMTVPNAATTQHSVVFETTDLKTINIYLDGIKWSTYEFATAQTIQAGFQIGGWYGGSAETTDKCYRQALDTATDKTATNSYVSAVRIFNAALGPNAIKAFAEEFPYHSPYGTYTRDVTEDGLWVATGAWKNESTAEMVDQPADKSSVQLDNTGDAPVTVKFNSATDVTYEGLTLSGDHAITIAANDVAPKGGKIKFTSLVSIGCDVTNDYAAIDIAGVPLNVSAGKTLTFDFRSIDLSTYYADKEYQITGTRNLGTGSKVEAILPAEVAGRTATFAFDENKGYYTLTIAMDGPITGTVNKTGTWGAEGVITWKAGDVVIDEPDWSVYTSPATLVVEGENSYTLTYPTPISSVPATIAKSGTGTLGIASGNNGKSYVVDAGTLKFASKKDNGAANITVNANGTFDLNGGSGGDPNLAVTLNGGKLANNGTTDMGVGKRQFSSITLTADSTVGGTKALYFVSNGYAANTLELGGHTLSKVDNNTFGLCNTTVKNGTLAVEAGTLDFGRNASTFNANATLVVADGATLKTSITQGNPAVQIFGGTDMSRWSSVTGSVVVADGALQIGNNNNEKGGVTAGEYKFGKSITVNSGKTLRLWIWATRDQTFNRNTKAVLTTPVTLNGSTIYTQDGAYWFDSITVNGTGNTMQFNWNKSHGIGTLNGDESAALTLTRSQSESFLQYFAIDGGDFNGTLTVNNTDGGADSDFWLSPKGEVLKDATVQCQGTGRPTYIVIRDNATLGEVTGDKFAGIFGDGTGAHTVTLTQGTYAAPIKDISTGTSSTYPLSVVIAGNVVAITGESAYTGTTTISAGAKLDAALGEGLPRASTITIAEGGQLVVDLENFVTVAETSPAYTFSGDLPANALDIRNQDKYPWISIGTSGENLGKVIIDETKLPFTGLHIVKMLPKHTSKAADRDPNGRDSGWVDIVNYGPTETNLANYKIVRSNIGKKVKSADSDLARLCSYTLQKGETFRIYTSEEYETAEDYGGKGKEVAWFKTIDGVVTKLDAYQEGAIMVVPTKVNPKKFPMVRLYDYSTNEKGDVIDEVIVPCDMDDNMMLEVVANTNKLERRVVYPNGEKVECGPVVNSLYGVKDVKGDLDLMKPGKFAPAGQAYPVKIPVNPLMTGGKALDANTITGVNLIYRVFDPATITVSNKVALTSRTITAEDPDVAKYGEGCLLWEDNIPAGVFVDANRGKLVQFRAEITDKGGKTWIYPNNMNPDIGYGWYGVVVEPTIIETPGTDITSTSVCTNSLQTFLMFIDDANKAQMDKDIDDPTLTLTYGARLAIYDVANHTYYDNVRIDLRGQTSKTFYKKSHGLRFNKVAPLVAKDPFTGDKYETRKTSFIAEYGDPMYLRQTLALRLMRESGIKAPFDWPVRLYLNGTFYQLAFHSSRFSDEAVEDFYGLNKYGYSYKNVHQMITGGEGAEKKTPDDDNEADMTVYNEFINRIYDKTTPKTADQLTTDAMKHFNIPAWVNYLAATKVTQEADDVWTNLGLYINKYDSFFNANGDDTMMPLAYDMNLSWGQWYYRDDTARGHIGIVATNDLMKSHPFYGGANVKYHFNNGSEKPEYNRGMEAILQNAQFREMLSRRLRTLAEQYLGAQDATKEETPVWDWVVAYTNAIAGDVQIDRTMWKYDEKVISTTTNIWVWSTALTFDEGVEDLWANYIVPRRKHLYDTHAAENAGKTGYPAAGGGYATGSSALIPETQAATETFGKRGALYFTDLNGNKPGEDGFDITTDKILGICNTNNVAIDMSYWTVEGAVVATLKPGTVIPANGTLWIVDDRRTASDKVVAKGLAKPIVVNLDKTLVDEKGNPVEVFTDATDQLFLKDADGTPAITHEATIGTKYYITLLDAFNCAETNDIVALLTDINNQTPAAVKTSVFLYGDTNTLTGAGFDVADGQTLTIASGQIANGALGASPTVGKIVLIGGKYTEVGKEAYEAAGIVSNQYHFAEIGLPEGVYTYQVVPGEQSKVTDDEIVLPVAQVEETTSTTNDTGVLAFSKAWLKEKGLATDEQLATTEGKKTVVNNLNTHQTNKIQAWENAVLGLDGSKAENIPVILPKQTKDATKVTFKMANQDKVSTDSGAIVTYKVWMGSTPKGKDIGSSEAVLYTQDTSMPLPEKGVQYYMLEVITTPAK